MFINFFSDTFSKSEKRFSSIRYKTTDFTLQILALDKSHQCSPISTSCFVRFSFVARPPPRWLFKTILTQHCWTRTVVVPVPRLRTWIVDRRIHVADNVHNDNIHNDNVLVYALIKLVIFFHLLLFILLLFWLLIKTIRFARCRMTASLENLSLKSKEVNDDDDDDVVDPWNVCSKSKTGIDYDKLISKQFLLWISFRWFQYSVRVSFKM